jgi:CRP-like cAMP-binding protein
LRDGVRTRTLGQAGNDFLDSLEPGDFERLNRHLELLPMRFGDVLYEAGGSTAYVHFPVNSVVSMLCLTNEHESAEIAVAGSEGLIGIQLLMGRDTIPGRAVVHTAGSGYRLPGAVMKEAFATRPALRIRVLRYAQALMTQMAQTAACNRHHAIEQQVCRLLLLTLDRVHSSNLLMTHDLISRRLGVRREGVSQAAHRLQREGVIAYARGHMTVSRSGLERAACECYEVVKAEYDRLLND